MKLKKILAVLLMLFCVTSAFTGCRVVIDDDSEPIVQTDEYGNVIVQTDKDGNVVKQTDKNGKPVNTPTKK